MAVVNPYDVSSAPQANPGLLAAAMPQPAAVTAPTTASQVAMIDSSAFDPAKVTPAGTVTPSTYQASTGTSTGYNAAQATATKWNPDDKSTVAGQLSGILSSNSPLLQQAQTRAAQSMNSRGLLNTSMAIGAGESALYDAALPIAQADAATFGSAGKYNADVDNTTSQFNTNATNTSSQFTAGAKNAQEQQNVAALNSASSQNSQQTQAAGTTNANSANALQSQLLQTTAAQSAANADARNKAVSQDATAALQAGLANQDTASKTALAQYQGAIQVALANTDAQGKLQLQQISAATQQSLAQIEATYKNQMQASQSAAQMYAQTVQNISNITMDKDLDSSAKQAAISQQIDMLKAGFQLQENVSGLDLGNVLNFSSGDLGAPTSVTTKPVTNATGTNDQGLIFSTNQNLVPKDTAPAPTVTTPTAPAPSQPAAGFDQNNPKVGDSPFGVVNGVPTYGTVASVTPKGSVLTDGSFVVKGTSTRVPGVRTEAEVMQALGGAKVLRVVTSDQVNFNTDGTVTIPHRGQTLPLSQLLHYDGKFVIASGPVPGSAGL